MKARTVLSGAVVLSVLATMAFTATGAAAAARVPGSSGTVKIVTDSAGIPHIRASNFRSLGYGEAWAFAEGNFCTLANDFVTVNGDRSRYFGPGNLAVNYSAGVDPTNLDSDLFWQVVKNSGSYRAQMNAKPPVGAIPQVLQLFKGYVAGYNAYLASGDLTDPACAGQPWVRPITLKDLWLRGVQIATEASSEQFISNEAQATPPQGAATSTG